MCYLHVQSELLNNSIVNFKSTKTFHIQKLKLEILYAQGEEIIQTPHSLCFREQSL